MKVEASHRNARMAPRKIRILREIIKGLPVDQAAAQLKFLPGQGPALLRQVLHSAVSNAEHNFELQSQNLKISEVVIDGGFVMKRFRPAAKGMAHPILKRTSHITIILDEIKAAATPKKRKVRKTDIIELTADDIAEGKLNKEEIHEEVETKEVKGKPKNTPHPSKQEEAYTKMKMQQLGGDVKKSHRRKSLSGE